MRSTPVQSCRLDSLEQDCSFLSRTSGVTKCVWNQLAILKLLPWKMGRKVSSFVGIMMFCPVRSSKTVLIVTTKAH